MSNVREFEELSVAEKHAFLDKLKAERRTAYQERRQSKKALAEHLKLLKNPVRRNPFFQHLEKEKGGKER
jgi:hypothetical protein